MGDVDESHYDNLLYGHENSDSELKSSLEDADAEEETYLNEDLQNSALSYIYFIPTDSLKPQEQRPSSSSAPFIPIDDAPKRSSRRQETIDDSRYNMLQQNKHIVFSGSSDEEEDKIPIEVFSTASETFESSSDEDHDTCKPKSRKMEGDEKLSSHNTNGKKESDVSNQTLLESLPHRVIVAEDISKMILKNSDLPKEDYSKWDNKKYRIFNRYYGADEEALNYPNKRSRESSSPDNEYDVVIPCIRCKEDHPRAFNCKVIRCHACMELDDHTTMDCPYFRFQRCNICHVRFHDDQKCPFRNSTDAHCTDCPKLPLHLPENCPRLWRVYVENTGNTKEKKEFIKTCSYCGHPHLFDSCSDAHRTKKFQTPWNKFPLHERQATVKAKKPEPYVLSNFVFETLNASSSLQQPSSRNHYSASPSSRHSHGKEDIRYGHGEDRKRAPRSFPDRPRQSLQSMFQDRSQYSSKHQSPASPWRNTHKPHHPPAYPPKKQYTLKYPDFNQDHSSSSHYRGGGGYNR